MLDWTDYPNFTEAEFRCKCGCGRAEMKPRFMNWLQGLRTAAGFVFDVNSGFRCPEYNDRVSSTGLAGPHTTGEAVDIGVARKDAHELTRLAFVDGVSGYGAKQRGGGRFLHLDLCTEAGGHVPRPTIWTY